MREIFLSPPYAYLICVYPHDSRKHAAVTLRELSATLRHHLLRTVRTSSCRIFPRKVTAGSLPSVADDRFEIPCSEDVFPLCSADRNLEEFRPDALPSSLPRRFRPSPYLRLGLLQRPRVLSSLGGGRLLKMNSSRSERASETRRACVACVLASLDWQRSCGHSRVWLPAGFASVSLKAGGFRGG
ncbi:hypothetical protein CEXT_802761 [Caerostris extrusa]|uniref:Uncharacterized protein n=1 Tax=Caerostris extrusa TaxID=172846 RepID=A0AAV4M4E3_CAEEX|nr:hypothetical protein CEXT_802761 [Caerostris extrusa]